MKNENRDKTLMQMHNYAQRNKTINEIFNEDIEYFGYAKGQSKTKFIIVKLNKTRQWMKIMLKEDYSWMSYNINNGIYCLLALTNLEPTFVHHRKPYLFGMSETVGVSTLTSTIQKISIVMNEANINTASHNSKALTSFNSLFGGVITNG